MRLAFGIESRDGIDDLGDGVWRMGDARRSPVLLARNLARVLHEPALLDRVRVANGNIRVITPKPNTTRGSPFGAGVKWMALEIKAQASCAAIDQSSNADDELTASASGGSSCVLRVWPFCKMPTATR